MERKRGRFCAPQIRRKQPARPLTRLPAQRTRGLSPRSRPLTVLVWRLPKNALCISISRPFLSLASLAQGHLGSPVQSRRHSFPPSLGFSAPACPRRNPKRTAKKEQWAWGHPACHIPQSPPKPSPAPGTLDYPNECHSDLGTSVGLWPASLAASLGFLCAPVPRHCPRACPPDPGWGAPWVTSAALVSLPPVEEIAAKPGSTRAKKWKGERLSCRASSLPTLPPQRRPSESQLQLFPFRLGFPLGCGERSRGR